MVCTAWTTTGVRRPGKSHGLRLDTTADGDDSSTGVCRTTGLGLVDAVSTSDWIGGDRRQASGVGRILCKNVGARRLSARAVDALRQQRTADYKCCRRVAQQPQHSLRDTASLFASLPALAAKVSIRSTEPVYPTGCWKTTETATGEHIWRLIMTYGRRRSAMEWT